MPLSPSNTGMRSASGQQPSFMTAQRTGGGAFGAPTRGQSMSTAPKWAVTADEKAKADRFFDGLDTERTGSLDGGSVVPFFMQSKLSEQTLALVWDLSDITQSGSLTREEFAVAMHLINSALTGSEVPQELPADLIPPSLRGQDLPDAVNPQQTDTQKDLFSLMDDDDVQSQQLPVNAASAFAAPVSGAPVVPGTATTNQPQQSNTRSTADSAFDDDFFGSTTSSRQIGSPAATTRSAAPAAQLPSDQSAEYGNKSIQLNSTQKAVDDLQSKRGNLESSVSQNAASLAELETRLTTVRSTHDTESRLVKELEARRDKQAVELKDLRDGLISAESELSRLKGEKDEIEQQVMHDREEVRETKKKMGDVQTALTALKAEVEKLRKEGRQQKGMVAIAKKQLSTAETEHEKTSLEKTQLEQQPAQVAEAEDEAPFATSAAPSTERSAPAVPGGFESVVSPGGSVRSNNPFDRFKGSSSPAVASPMEQPREQQQSSEQSSSGLGAIAGGAAAGIAAATAGVGAMLLGESHDDKDKATSEQQTVPASREMEDPWATSSGPVAVTSNQPSADGFDDTFGDDFAPTTNTASQGLSSHNAAFDDAFSGFDDAPSQQQQQHSRDDPTPFEPPTHSSEPAHVEDSTDTGGSMASDLPTAAPTADQVATDEDVSPVNALETPAVASSLDKGKAPIRGDQDDDASLSSDDDDGDDEGPEDLENPRYGSSGAAAASGLSRSDSPDEVGYGKTPEQDVPTSDPSTVSGVAASGLPPAETAAVASQRFPKLPTDDEIASQAANAGPDASTGASEDPFPASTDQSSYTGAGSRGLAVPSSASFGGPGAISSQATGASDAFFDASADGLPSSASGGFGSTSGLAGLAAGRGGAAAALGSSAFGGSQAPQQSDDPFGAATQTDGHNLSPASSMKTRRAPPPAPVRSGTNSTTSTQLPPSNASAAPASNSNFFGQGTTAQPQQTSFDDFEAAFNDLDLPHGNTAAAASAGQRGASGAATEASASPDQFDDEFADADFDFVPSFADSNSNGGQGAQQQQQSSSAGFPTTTSNNDAFSGFDDAFGNAPAGPTATSTDIAQQPRAGGVSSGTSSGFSFEDAFAPSQGTGPAPSLPTRSTPATFDNPAPANNNLSAPATTEASGPRAPSPANLDDAPAVRQLAGMGFSRGKVIAALEKSNYKVNAALERLLADA